MVRIDSTDSTALHREAMSFCDAAEKMRRLKPDDGRIADMLKEAYRFEARAAQLCPLVQPSHAILHRSAATLALDCGEMAAARELVEAGLAGNPPEEIAVELRDVLRRINDSRVDQMQLIGHVKINDEIILLLIRPNLNRCYVVLKARHSGAKGIHLDDEAICLRENPDILQRLRAGETIKLWRHREDTFYKVWYNSKKQIR